MTPAEDADLSGRVIGGRYRLVERLGRGGMGVVYRAVQLELGRHVAVKLMRPKMAARPEGLGRFRREAKAAARLGHPNIVQVTDFGQLDDGGAYLAMELLRGESMRDAMRVAWRLPPERVASIARQVCAALEAAHEAGIVHRDLKPPNVFLVRLDDDRDLVKLLDFGVAKLIDEVEWAKLTATGSVVGTPAYMAPEQLMGKTVDGRSDVYALGVVMYEALAGKRPFGDRQGGEFLRALLEETPEPLSSLVPGVDPDLAGIVMRAMARHPDQRFPRARDMRRALDALSARNLARTISVERARPPPTASTVAARPTPSAPPRRRRRLVPPMILAAALGLGAIVGLAVAAVALLSTEEGDARTLSAPDAAPPTVTLAPVEPLKPPVPLARTDAADAGHATDEPGSPTEARRVHRAGTGPEADGRAVAEGSAPRDDRVGFASGTSVDGITVVVTRAQVHGAFTFSPVRLHPVAFEAARCLARQGVTPSPPRTACVRVTVSPQGFVQRIETSDPAHGDATVERCVADHIGRLILLESADGQPGSVDACFTARPAR